MNVRNICETTGVHLTGSKCASVLGQKQMSVRTKHPPDEGPYPSPPLHLSALAQHCNNRDFNVLSLQDPHLLKFETWQFFICCGAKSSAWNKPTWRVRPLCGRVGPKFDARICFIQGDHRNLLCCEWHKPWKKHSMRRVMNTMKITQQRWGELASLTPTSLINNVFRAGNSQTQIRRVIRNPGNAA